jgi:hypothetical protein
VIGLCDRFKCLPSALLAEDMDLLRMIKIVEYGREDEAP